VPLPYRPATMRNKRNTRGFGAMLQLFTRTTAVLNLAACHAALIGTVVGPQWLAFAGAVGVLTMTG
jgi:hypothetical protein